ncbi:hypothetical protein [Chitinophaga sp. MD30]|uniref:hypothetical protein n=1 Tax=Chitinophaga sp. MD30 TaxID=2033437 RepID=UPI000BAF14B2|nr:hypothetical protein [Chitinophaga sp. MD30]ASZ10197.1 hypothetical protein CK934_03980 [Chitinophaga sp. MD30]
MSRSTGLIAAGTIMLLVANMTVNAATPTNITTGSTYVSTMADWAKSKTGTWAGAKEGKTLWYKLDKQAKVWWSEDGKKWAAVPDGAWADKAGKWLKIHDKKLVWSADGKEWSEVPEWKWEGADGKWYKFDSKWTLWVNE